MDESTTLQIQRCLNQLQAGDEASRDQLIRAANHRLQALVSRLLRQFPGVQRWEQSSDVFQNAALRLHSALKETVPTSTRGFLQLASKVIRRELIDLLRHHFGPHGAGANHESHEVRSDVPEQSAANAEADAGKLENWTRFHECVEKLADDEREVFELMWYQELSQ